MWLHYNRTQWRAMGIYSIADIILIIFKLLFRGAAQNSQWCIRIEKVTELLEKLYGKN